MFCLFSRRPRLAAVTGVGAAMLLAFATPALAGNTELVSQTDIETLPDNQTLGFRADASPEGRYVVFESLATNLFAGSGSIYAVYIRDTVAKTTRPVSITAASEAFAVRHEGHTPSVSDDGQRVAFVSTEALVADDTNGIPDVYVRMRDKGAVRLVSRDRYGALLTGTTIPSEPRISGNGRYVVFTANSKGMGFGPTQIANVFRVDLEAIPMKAVLVSSTDYVTPATNVSTAPDVSFDGKTIAFYSFAKNLIAGREKGVYTSTLGPLKPGLEFNSYDNKGNFQHPFGTPEPSVNLSGQRVAFDGMWATKAGQTNYNVAAVFDRAAGNTIREYEPPLDRTAYADTPTVDGRSVVLSDNGQFMIVTTRPTTDSNLLSTFQITVVHVASGAKRVLTRTPAPYPTSGFGIGISNDGLRATFVSRAGHLLIANSPSLADKTQVYQQILPSNWWLS